MNSIAENTLYIYLIVFLSMLVFDVVSILYRKVTDKNTELLTKKIEEQIANKKSEDISPDDIKRLAKNLKKIGYFIAFTSAIDSMPEDRRKKYLTKIKSVFSEILPHYQKEETIRQTYFIHFLAQYPYLYEENMDRVLSYIIQCTTKDSVYLRENALNTLYSIGKTSYIKEAFFQMNYLNIKHHHKLITDGLMKYRGDTKELANMLIEELKNYDEDYKVACINFFGYKKIDCNEFIYKILTSPIEHKEVKIACIRYFSNVHYEPVIETLYELLQDDKNNWEYSAIAAMTLKKYPDKKTLEALKMAVRSHNWYVRANAAASLIELTKEEKRKDLIRSIDDLYAKEALSYQLHLLGGDV